MPTSAAGFLLGILALLSLPVLPALDGAAPALLLLAAALGVLRATSRPLAFAILGFLHAHAVAGSVLSNRLPHDLEGVVLDLEGEVATLPSETPLRSRFEFTVGHAATAAGESLGWGAGARVRLSWYERRGVPRTRLRGGERLTLRVKLRRPRGLANPAGFDYERWLFAQRIAATGYVVGARLPERLETGFGLTALRAELAARLRQQAANVARPAMLEALTLGARGGLDAGEWQQLRDTGTGHLVAISGLHVGMLALLGYAIVRRGWALSARLTQCVAAPRAAAVLALLLATAYAALAGFTLPTQRALAMVAVVMVAIMTKIVNHTTL